MENRAAPEKTLIFCDGTCGLLRFIQMKRNRGELSKMKPADYARIGALIATIALAKALSPAGGQSPETASEVDPGAIRPAPVYVKTISAPEVTAPVQGHDV